jgi:Na+(H+)/acetate symporter ActP
MKKNMGSIDRGIRIAAAIVIAVLYLTGEITGTAAVILGIIAVIFILTGLISVCPLYLPFKISTMKKEKV